MEGLDGEDLLSEIVHGSHPASSHTPLAAPNVLGSDGSEQPSSPPERRPLPEGTQNNVVVGGWEAWNRFDTISWLLLIMTSVFVLFGKRLASVEP